MICEPCKKAGLMNADANAAPDKDPAPRRQTARILHGGCQGGTQCDCQHLVGWFRGKP